MSNPPLIPPAERDPISLPFLALLGLLTGGLPPLIMPTASMFNVIGNAVMGAFLVVVLDLILVRRNLAPGQLTKGRVVLLIFVSVTLAIVTYRPASLIFQDIFNTAPPPGTRNVSARAFMPTFPGPVNYRLAFDADPVAVQTIQDRMGPLLQRPGTTFAEFQAGAVWADFVATHVPKDSPLAAAALKFEQPRGYLWTSPTPNNSTAKTILLRDNKTGLTIVEHIAG